MLLRGMSEIDDDGGESWFEYAVRRPGPAALAIGPLPHQQADILARETGGTIIRRRITHGAWVVA